MRGMLRVCGPACPRRVLGVRLPRLLQALSLLGAFFAACLSASSPAFAQAVPPTLITCSAQTDSSERLACYDREIARLRQLTATTSGGARPSSATPTAPAAVTATPSPNSVAPAVTSSPPVAIAPPPNSYAPPDPNNPVDIDRFGLTPDMQHQRQAEGRAPKELAQVTAHVTSVRYLARGEIVVGLDNNQTWQQAEYDGDVSMNVGDPVTIKAGALGAYYMKPRVGRIVRVRRLR
jgi:hypothetical protein